MYNNYLIHYGVKGMKWGVRHDKDRVRLLYRTSRLAGDLDRASSDNRKSMLRAAKSLKKLKQEQARYSEKYNSDVEIKFKKYNGKTYANVILEKEPDVTINTVVNGELYKRGKRYIRNNTTSFNDID